MVEFLLTFILLVTVVAGMAIGVLRGRAPIQGSCGGLGNLEAKLGTAGACEICGGEPARCPQGDALPPAKGKGAFYDAS